MSQSTYSVAKSRIGLEGYTTLELLVVMGIIGIITGLSLKGITQHSSDRELLRAAQELEHTLRLAQSLSIQTRGPVIFCPSVNLKACASTWKGSYLIKVASTRSIDQSRDSNTSGILHKGLLPIGVELHYKGYPLSTEILFKGNGYSTSNGAFILSTPHTSKTVEVIVAQSGRVRILEKSR